MTKYIDIAGQRQIPAIGIGTWYMGRIPPAGNRKSVRFRQGWMPVCGWWIPLKCMQRVAPKKW